MPTRRPDSWRAPRAATASCGHRPPRTSASAHTTERSTANVAARHHSATAIALKPAAFATGMPRVANAARSTVSTPTLGCWTNATCGAWAAAASSRGADRTSRRGPGRRRPARPAGPTGHGRRGPRHRRAARRTTPGAARAAAAAGRRGASCRSRGGILPDPQVPAGSAEDHSSGTWVTPAPLVTKASAVLRFPGSSARDAHREQEPSWESSVVGPCVPSPRRCSWPRSSPRRPRAGPASASSRGTRCQRSPCATTRPWPS